MRILIYTHEFVPWGGGIATYNYELARGFSELGHEVVVLAPKYSNKDVIFDRKVPFNVVRANLPRHRIMVLNRNIIELPASAYCFLKALWHYKPDHVLITEAVAHESAALARLFYPFRFTLTVHGTEVYWHFIGGKTKQWSKSRLMRWFFHKANRIICVSNSTKNLLEQSVSNLQNRTSVVYIGIDPDGFYVSKNSKAILERFDLSDQKVILTVARLTSGKGQDVVIQALPKVLKEIPNTKYLLVGDGPKRPELEKLAEKLGVKESVLFAGFGDEECIGSFYEICDIFAMLSRRGKRESFGIVYLEAWAHGKPVIGSNVGGVSEVIDHEKTGLLIDDPMNVNAAAEAMCHLLKNEDLTKAMGKAGRKKVEEVFSRKIMAQKTLELL